MSARPIAVGDRVRTVRSHLEDERVGVVVHIGDQSPRGYGEPYSVGVRLDDDGRYLGGSTLGYRLSELERLDDTREAMDFNPDELERLKVSPSTCRDQIANSHPIQRARDTSSTVGALRPVIEEARVTVADVLRQASEQSRRLGLLLEQDVAGCEPRAVAAAVGGRAEPPEAGAASAHDAAPARVTYLDPAFTRCPGCKTCRVREARARHQAERDPRLVAEALRRDGVHCRYCGTPVAVGAGPRRAGYGRVRATAYGVMLICGECSRRRVDEEHAPLPLGASAVRPVVSVELDEAGASGDPHLAEGIVTTVARGVGLIDDRRDCAEPHRDVDGSSLRGELDEEASALDERVGDGEGERRRVFVVDRVPGACVLDVAHETSPSGRAEAPESPQLMTDTVGDGSAADTSLPTVGGRAVPPVPAPADTTTSSAPLPEDQAAVAFPCTTSATSEPRPPVRGTGNRIGATSAHDAAPITDLTTLRDSAHRLHDLRAQIDQLIADEAALATAVSAGLTIVLGMPSDLTSWGADA